MTAKKNRVNKSNRNDIHEFIEQLNKKSRIRNEDGKDKHFYDNGANSSAAVIATMERWNISMGAALKEVQEVWRYDETLPKPNNAFATFLELVERDAGYPSGSLGGGRRRDEEN